jgi:membrane protein implicated in regulation of membrane protease activity
MTWWMWILIGLTCLVLELMTPGGVIMLFFGVAGLLVGILVAVGLGGPVWFQVLAFSILSIVSLLTLRGPVLRRMKSGGQSLKIDTLVGKEVVLLESLVAGDVGKAELRGTVWEARTTSSTPLKKNTRCLVERVDGLSLWVRVAADGPADKRQEGESP